MRDDTEIDEFDTESLAEADIDAARSAARDTAVRLGRRTILALSGMLHDAKFSAQSRVAAGNGILRAGGFFDRAVGDGGEKNLAEMSAGELRRELARLRGIASNSSGRNIAPPVEADGEAPEGTSGDIFG